jgi:hypothetical protein
VRRGNLWADLIPAAGLPRLEGLTAWSGGGRSLDLLSWSSSPLMLAAATSDGQMEDRDDTEMKATYCDEYCVIMRGSAR